MRVADEQSQGVRLSMGGVFVEGLVDRDYARLASSLSDEVCLRALLPPGPMTFAGQGEVTEAFRSWFGSATDFEAVDVTVGEVGGRLHLSWRLRVRPAPFGIGKGWHVIEQHVFADVGDRIERMDLLCSGFAAERTRRR